MTRRPLTASRVKYYYDEYDLYNPIYALHNPRSFPKIPQNVNGQKIPNPNNPQVLPPPPVREGAGLGPPLDNPSGAGVGAGTSETGGAPIRANISLRFAKFNDTYPVDSNNFVPAKE
jgi:hypothetical protein